MIFCLQNVLMELLIVSNVLVLTSEVCFVLLKKKSVMMSSAHPPGTELVVCSCAFIS